VERDTAEAQAATERALRGAELTRRVEADLAEAAKERRRDRWERAWAALERAEGRLGEAGPEELRRLVRALRGQFERARKDQEMFAKLEEARFQYVAPTADGFDYSGADRLYAEAFDWYGLDLDRVPTEEAVDRLRASGRAADFVPFLDNWSRGLTAGRRRQQVAALADGVDPDDWRRRVRRALRERDWTALRALADGLDAEAPSSSVILLAYGLRLAGDPSRGLALLLRARQRWPGDFELALDVGIECHGCTPPASEEAVRCFTAALALRPDSTIVHHYLGNALATHGKIPEALAEFREALRLKPDYSGAHTSLGKVLYGQGRYPEAEAEFRAALRLKPDDPEAENELGYALNARGKFPEAMASFREALRLQPDFAWAHNNLGYILSLEGNSSEAIIEYREALRLEIDFPTAHNNFAFTLLKLGRVAEAAASFQEALRLQPDFPMAHYNLGIALQRLGRPAEAVACYQEAVRLRPDHADTYLNLGSALTQLGRFQPALEAYRRSDAVGRQQPNWNDRSERWIRQAERLVELDSRLPALLRGDGKARDAAEPLELAGLCALKRWHAAAARFSAEAFEERPALARDLNRPHRYNAACHAALASGGGGEDAAGLSAHDRACLRQQALNWLRDEQAARQAQLRSDRAGEAAAARQSLEHWRQDSDLASVRDKEALAKLPDWERDDWQQLWADLDAALKK
jgi:Flp pilus assembly protein TadD